MILKDEPEMSASAYLTSPPPTVSEGAGGRSPVHNAGQFGEGEAGMNLAAGQPAVSQAGGYASVLQREQVVRRAGSSPH